MPCSAVARRGAVAGGAHVGGGGVSLPLAVYLARVLAHWAGVCQVRFLQHPNDRLIFSCPASGNN